MSDGKPETKLDRIKAYAASHPTDPFARYGLAMEYKNTGETDQAIAAFATLQAEFPQYVPAYLMAGYTLVAAGKPDEARAVYEAGLTAARAAGNQHAAGELQNALDDLD